MRGDSQRNEMAKLQAVKHEDSSDTKLALPPCIYSHSIILPVCAHVFVYLATQPRSAATFGAQLRHNLSNPEYWQHEQSVPPRRMPASPLTAYIVSRKTRDRRPMQTWATLKELKIHFFFFFKSHIQHGGHFHSQSSVYISKRTKVCSACFRW